MAFELCDDLNRRPFVIRSKGSSLVIRERVGWDNFRNSNYFVHVGLEACPLVGQEYFFCMVDADAVSRTHDAYYSGRTVARLIGAADRAEILSLVLRATKHLLNNIKPDQVHRCCHDAALPPEALEKHEAISLVFADCGYAIARSGASHGKRFWIMKRAGA